MPKLTIPERTYGKAIGCLIDLYKKEPGFIEELQKIRSVYEPAVITWLDSSVPQWRRLQVELMQAKDRQDDSTTLSDGNIELSKELSYNVRRFYEGWNVTSELIDYEKELHDLAYKWHLKAKWSGVVLLLSHINDVVGIMSEGDETTIEMPVEVIEPMLDKPPLSPLIFKVTAFELMYSGQGEIVREFANKLSDYEKELKSLGWTELPSAIKTHASWWFEHYVHRKSYEEIVAEHSVEVNENSVRQAVFRFRKLLGIEIG
ncbi:hypothetical protein ACFLVF_02380 [Chloroflexota bacterium]